MTTCMLKMFQNLDEHYRSPICRSPIHNGLSNLTTYYKCTYTNTYYDLVVVWICCEKLNLFFVKLMN